MAECKFKVGEVCRGRSGFQYKIIAIDTESAPEYQLVVRRLDLGYITTRRIDGRSYAQRDSDSDILPNKRKEWVVTYQYNDDFTGTWYHACQVFSEDQDGTARTYANILRAKPEVYRSVRGPMLWESED